MMELIPYFNFNGNATEAIAFYEKAFGAKALNTMRYGDMPGNPGMPPIPDEKKGWIMQCLMDFDGQQVRLSDCDSEITEGNRIALAVTVENEDRVRSLFDDLKEGGKEIMAPQKTFFSPCYGQVTDKYGITWQLIAQAE